jgi:hypothetical protein
MTTPSEPKKSAVGDYADPNNPQQFTPDQLKKLMSSKKDADLEAKVIAWVKSEYTKSRTARGYLERQWYINMAFYCSRQNVSIMPYSNGSSPSMGIRLYVPPVPNYRSRPVFNRIRPIIRKELAKLTAQKPTAVIVPSTSEDRDLYAAQAGEQIWDSVYRDKKISRPFNQAVFWALTTGNGFMKHYWNPSAKDPQGNVGDFCYENVSPFNLFFPDLITHDIENQPYIIHLQTRTPQWIKLNYGIDVSPDTMEASDILNDSFLTLVGASGFRKDTVLVYEVWMKPNQNSLMPKGGMFTVIGDKLVQYVDSGIPYVHGQYPFTHIPSIPNGRFYADSLISDLVPVQREYNRTRGQIIENKNAMGMVKLMAAEGSIDPSKINTAPGQAILYKLGFPVPTPVSPVPLPAYVIQELDRLLQDFDDISGQHDVSNGQAPPGVTAATAISFLQEQDESILSYMFQNIEDAYEKIAKQTLCYVKQYWTVPRMVKVAGTTNQFSVMAFRGSDLGDNTDIRMEAGSALPTSKAGKQALLMDLMSQGFVPPDKGLELMDIGGVQRLYDQLQLDQSQATRENMKMAAVTPDVLMQYQMINSMNSMSPVASNPMDPSSQSLGTAQGMIQDSTSQGLPGQPGIPDPNNMPADMPPAMVQQAQQQTQAPPLIVPVNTYDNHQIHVQVHNDYRKSQEFENLTPEQKQLFEDHVNQHLTSMGMQPGATPEAQASQQQQQMQQGLGPLPPNNGSPGGPGNQPPNIDPSAGPPPSQPPMNQPPMNQPPMGGMPNG